MMLPDSTTYEFGPYRLNTAARNLFRNGEPVALQPKVIDVLLLLVSSRGAAVSKETFFKTVWTDSFVEESNLTQSIFVLRKTLAEGAEGQSFIETVPRHGYRFAAPVRTVEPIDETGDFERPVAEAPAAMSSAAGTSGRRKFVWLGGCAAIGAVGLVGSKLRPKGELRSDEPIAIAVLPFRNLSGDGSQEYLADGTTHSLTGELGKIRSLRVRSRTSVMRHKNSQRTIKEIAAELGVTAVVEGSVTRAGERVRVVCELIDTREDELLWSESFECGLPELPRVMGEAAARIAEEFRVRLTIDEQRRLSPGVPARGGAFEEYLRGRYFLEKSGPDSVETAIRHFKTAVAADDGFAAAYVGMAECYSRMGAVEVAAFHPREARALTIESAKRALAADGELADAHAWLGRAYLFDWEWENSEKAVQRALELNPSCVAARITAAQRLASLGRVPEARREVAAAKELDPLARNLKAMQCMLLRLERRYDEGIQQARMLVEAEPENPDLRGTLAVTYLHAGQPVLAIEEYERILKLSNGRFTALGFQAQAYAAAGDTARARTILIELLALEKRRYVTPCLLALIYLSLKQRGEFFAWYERAYKERANGMLWTKVESLYDPVREDPRFRKIESSIFERGMRPA